ncbi:MAG: DMT family transporter [Thermoleophilia bacterium]|nr:DMT family transporter [Thermoleophilia bacterium]
MTAWPSLVLALAAGAVLPLQAGINAELARWIGGAPRAAFVSFLVGALALVLVSLAATRGLLASDRVGAAPWWVWVGGLLGAFYVLGAIVAAPRVGAVVLVAAVVAGQALASLVLDHFGWAGFTPHAISPGRVVGMVLVGVGVALVRVF